MAGQPSSPSSTACSGRSVNWLECVGMSCRCETTRVWRHSPRLWYNGKTIIAEAFNEERQIPMTEFTDISYEVDNGLAWITINRPERYNAFRARTLDELIRAFKLAWASSEVGVICLTGAGEKAFCTGGDQKQRAETGDYGPSETG